MLMVLKYGSPFTTPSEPAAKTAGAAREDRVGRRQLDAEANRSNVRRVYSIRYIAVSVFSFKKRPE